MVCHHDRGTQRFQKHLFPDVVIGIVDKYTRVNISVCIDMEVTAASCDAASHILSVVLKVHGKQRFFGSVAADPLIGASALGRGGHQFRHGVISHRHIVEVPDKPGSQPDQLVQIFLRGDGFIVCTGVAGGNAVDQLFASQKLQGMEYLLIYAVPAPSVRSFFEALKGNGRDKISDAFLKQAVCI